MTRREIATSEALSLSHNNTARVLLLRRLVEHLTLFTERSRLFHQLEIGRAHV